MKKYRQYTISVIIALFLVACNNGSGSDLIKLVEERDSLRHALSSSTQQLEQYTQTVSLLGATLDSIAAEEHMIFRNEGEMPLSKNDIKANLQRFEDMLRSRERKIRQLEAQLSSDNGVNIETLSLINNLKSQLANKISEVTRLRAELNQKNITMAQLESKIMAQASTISAQENTISELDRQNQRKTEALTRQDAILNHGYVMLGTKDDLKRKGIVKKGQLVAAAALDKGKFMEVDIRKWREITFEAKHPRILTSMPPSSYELTTNGSGNFTLIVKNAADFWRVSSYLVIQTN